MIVKQADSYPISIFIAGDQAKAIEICRAYCDETGFCVTVTPTTYVYTGGQESGLIVGLINYPRFPSYGAALATRAQELSLRLREGLGQDSFTVQGPELAVFCSWREADCDSDAARSAETGTGSGPSGPASAVPSGNRPDTPGQAA